MSVLQSVYVARAKLPSMLEWCDAIRANGFALDLDRDIVLASHEGIVPCTYRGERAGFELYLGDVNAEELSAELASCVGDRNVWLSFATGGHLPDFVSAGVRRACACGDQRRALLRQRQRARDRSGRLHHGGKGI